MKVGQRIKAIRTEKKLSQKCLAQESGVGLATIQRIEYGQLNPKKETLHKIATALGVKDIELDDKLREMLEGWDEQVDLKRLSKEVEVFELLTEMHGEEITMVINDFLSLNSEGKQKASEYIDLLMYKYRK